ncbi:MAG TPA: hypothetical protein PLE18_07340, partial [Candidatus Sumerlaeota bacterium]|nr:hypothetical protein [Candidatus Sumerlaeota bacterium]
MLRKNLFALVTLLILSISSLGLADAIISTQIDSGDPSVAGDTLFIGVDVSSNVPPVNPGNFTLHVKWNSTSLTYLGVDDGELGAVMPGVVQASFTARSIDITAAGNAGNINPTPRLMTLRFQVNTPAFSSPYSITVEAISALVDPLVQTDMSTPIAVTFDNIVTTAIGGPITIAGNVTVSTQLVSGNSSIPGNLIDVDVVVSANNSIPLSNPGNFALRVIWDSTSLTFIGASDGDLGMVHPGPVEMNFLQRFVDITCDGNPMNVNLTPRFVTLHFQVNNPTFTSPYSIAIGADPDAPNPVLATDLFTDIPAVYDYSATSVLGLPIPVAGNVTVSTQLVSGNPSMPGNLIDVDVVVSANNTIPLTNPGNFALRAVWDSTSLTFIGASDGDLGEVHPGPVEMSFLNRFVDITCDGNPMNVNLTPRFVTLHFQVNNPTFTSPYSIAIGAD